MKKSDNANDGIIEQFIKKQNWPIYILIMASFFSWAAWGMVINNTIPNESREITIPLFYLTFFFAIASSFAMLASLLASSFSPRRSSGHVVNIGIRQGIILATIASIGMFFQQFRILTWWAAVLLLFLGILIEVSFNDKK